MRYLPLLFALFLTISGCRSTREATSTSSRAAAAVIIHIQNNNFYDATVYITAPSMFVLLGRIPSNTTRIFPLPDVYTGGEDFRFLVRFTGAPDYLHPAYISVIPGDTVYFAIAYHPIRSTVWISH